MRGEATPIRVAVLGAGGLGKAAATIIGMKRELRLCAICDSKGVVASREGLDPTILSSISGDLVSGYLEAIERSVEARSPAYFLLGSGSAKRNVSVKRTVDAGPPDLEVGGGARHCQDPLEAIIQLSDTVDAVLVALPNLPNEFIPSVVARFARAKRGLVCVDVLKRTRAVELMYALDDLIKASEAVVMTGCGATPGFLAAAAVLAAQSFIEVERVNIWWGVGIANWDAYKATIREDIAHLPGYTVERAKAMSDADIEALLTRTNGLLELRAMEHADDLLLERVGVVDARRQVEVGGVMDTRHPKKPVSTTMTLTGTTFDGKRASHTFTLGDETTMAANVIGPALGYLKRGMWLKAHEIYGVFGSTEFLPAVVR